TRDTGKLCYLKDEYAKQEQSASGSVESISTAIEVLRRIADAREQRRAEERATLRGELQRFLVSSTVEGYERLLKLFSGSASVHNVVSVVTITSIDAKTGAEKPGATIKYQNTAQRLVGAGARPTKCLTSCTEVMDTNEYYIWLERAGRVVSDSSALYR